MIIMYTSMTSVTYQISDMEKIIMKMISEEEEIYGYDLWKKLSLKGIKCHTNHLYVVLKEMEKKGILKGRWVDEGGHGGAKRHLYSIGSKGREAINSSLKDSLNLLMTSYLNHMRQVKDFSGFVKVLVQASIQLSLPVPAEGDRIVLAVPYHDPLTCYQLIFSMTDSFPYSSVYLVTPPKMEIFEQRSNMTVLHGWRYDIPLRDGFADFVILEGFPSQTSEEETIAECARVLKEGGNFVAQIKNTMVEEKVPEFPFFSEYVEMLYYELFEQDRKVSTDKLRTVLSTHFTDVKDTDINGTTMFYGKT